MTVRHLSIESATALRFDADITAPVCFVRGRHAELALDLLRELLGDGEITEDPDRVDDGRFVLYADVEMDEKHYAVTYIRNADAMGEYRIGVNVLSDRLAVSEEDTREFLAKCRARDKDGDNVLLRLSDAVKEGDDRPLYIYGYFDRLDEAIDLTPVFDVLSTLGRQVFVAVCHGYPAPAHAGVQTVDTWEVTANEA